MQLPSTINVTEQLVDISNLSKKQSGYYLDLAKDLVSRYEKGGEGRQLFTLSGPPGGGKSVIAAILEHIFREDSKFQFINVGLDAFHFSNTKLAELNLLDVKGRFDTYETGLLYEKLSQFKGGESVLFPIYSRLDHHPIPDRLPTANENILLLLEGQWLLRNTPEWDKIRQLSTCNYSVAGSIDTMRENVIQRHMAGGRTTEDAINFYASSDLLNTEEVIKNNVEPDNELLFYKDI